MNIYTSSEQLIGRTPLLELTHIEQHDDLKACILAKLESFNPAGSAKDRAALSMILDAERKGLLREGSVIIEPTSGNTGIGLASVAVTHGYRTLIVMPENMSEERIRILKAFGAELVLTPAAEGMTGAIRKAEQLAEEIPDSFMPGQFTNPANAMAHYRTTGPEIYADTEGLIDYFVAGVGTGGTLTGTGRYLKEHCPGIRIVAVEPEASPLLSGGKAGPHEIEGIGGGFVPEILDTTIYDEIITVSDADAMACGKRMAREEGLLVGISAGAALKAALDLAARPENEGKNIVVLFTDTGERYLSTPMFDE